MDKIITGEVIHGTQLGRKMGFPTANVVLDDSDDTQFGVYAATVALPDGRVFQAMAYVGMRPSVSGAAGKRAEASLFDFHGDLYGMTITIRLEEFIRPETRFDSIEALSNAIENDRKTILDYFATKDKSKKAIV